MKFKVHLIEDAEQDLFDIYRYITLSGYPLNAEKLIDQLEEACFKLEQMPERGHIPRELERIGVHNYREILFKVYRIIYQIIGSDVFIHFILDGRRNLQELLQQRLLR